MDPLTRKLFQPREAREKLRGMGGIMSSSPQLASTVAKFNVGGPIQSRGLAMPSAPDAPLPSAGRARATNVGGRAFVLTDDGRVLDAQTGAPAPPEVEAEVRSRLSPQLSMMDIEGGVSQIDPTGGGVNPSFREDTSGQLPPMPSDVGPMSVPAMPADPGAEFDMGAFQQDLIGAGRAAAGPGLMAIDDLSYDGPLISPVQPPRTPREDTHSADLRAAIEAAQANADTPTAPVADAVTAEETPETPVADVEPPVAETTAETPAAPTIDVDLNDPSTYDTDFEEMMRRLGGATGKEDKSSRQKAMADLAMIGLAIAAGQSPDALTNIAQGALTGMKAVRAEGAAKDAVASETRALAAKLATDREIARMRGSATSGVESTRQEYLYNATFNSAFQSLLAEIDPTDPNAIEEISKRARQVAANAAPGAPSARGAAATTTALPEVTTQEQFDALPAGAEFTQNGQRRRKPAE